MRRVIAGLGLCFLVVGCSSGEFSDRPQPKAPATKPAGDVTPDSASASSSLPTAEGDNKSKSPEGPLPTNCKAQQLLILDLKSGWWAGDGGVFFQDVISRELKLACPEGSPTVEYHHITNMTMPAQFYDKDFSVYTQVWLLSGSSKDIEDIDLATPELLDVFDKIKKFKPRVFLGAGFGSVDHANVLARALFNADAFATENNTGGVVSVMSPSDVVVQTRMTPGNSSALFAGVTADLPDQLSIGSQIVSTDEILAHVPGLTVAAQCHTFSGRSVPCVATAEAAGVELVLESGLQRFYALYDTKETHLSTYFRNILRWLSRSK